MPSTSAGALPCKETLLLHKLDNAVLAHQTLVLGHVQPFDRLFAIMPFGLRYPRVVDFRHIQLLIWKACNWKRLTIDDRQFRYGSNQFMNTDQSQESQKRDLKKQNLE